MMIIGAAGTTGVFQKETDDEQRGQVYNMCIYIYLSYKYVFLPVNGCIIFGAHLVKTPN